ncbi:TPA: hypothetical protein U1340_001934 [Streptococcus suis]|nr:hypothetical protein [Streptococcus suis]HEM5205505.1 hypothetical protein [Streptococcus suis]HEM5215995.1 hypothetical protein [Streptococcus suis]
MTFDYTFGLDLPELKKIISTKQFELSEELMDLRFELSFSEEQMADLIGISFQEYLQMEFGIEDIPINKYNMALARAKEYISQENTHKSFDVLFTFFDFTEPSYSSHRELYNFDLGMISEVDSEVDIVPKFLNYDIHKIMKKELQPFKDTSKSKIFNFHESFNLPEIFTTKQNEDVSEFVDKEIIMSM